MSHHVSVRLTGWILTLSLILMIEPLFFLMANGDSAQEPLHDSTSSVSENASSASENSVPESVSSDSLTDTPKATEAPTKTPEDPGGDPYTPAVPVTSSPAESAETPKVTGTPTATPTVTGTPMATPTVTGTSTRTESSSHEDAGKNTNASSANANESEQDRSSSTGVKKETTSPTVERKSAQNPSHETKEEGKTATKTESAGTKAEKPGKESAAKSSETKEEKRDKDEDEHKEEEVKDTKAPTLVIYGVGDHSSVNKPVTVTVRVLEEHPSSRGLFARLTGASRGQVPLTQRMKREKGEIVYTLGPVREDDIYALSLAAEDAFGHRTSKKLTFTINTKGAAFSVLSPESKKMSKAFTPRIFIDDLEEVRITSCAINNEEQAFSMRGNVLTFSETITEEGRYTITVETIDAAGNENAMEPYTVTLSYKKKGIFDTITSFLGRKHETRSAENEESSSAEEDVTEEALHESEKKENAEAGGGKIKEHVPEAKRGTSSKAAAEDRRALTRQGKSAKKTRKKPAVFGAALLVTLICAVFAVFWLRIRRKRRMAS